MFYKLINKEVFNISVNPLFPIGIVFLAFLFIIGTIIIPLIKRSSLRAKGLNATLDVHSKNKLASVFMEEHESFVTALGIGFILNFLASQQVGQGFAIVSNKRVYFKGKCYSFQNGKFTTMFEERTVDVKDITGTGYKRKNPTFLLIGFIVSFVVFVATLVLVITEVETIEEIGLILLILGFMGSIIFGPLYMLKRVNLFEISYAGGNIAFDTYLYNKAEIDAFQKHLRLAKDTALATNGMLPEQSVQTTGNALGIADELQKYAELLQQGLMTKEEFDEVKKKLLV